MVSNYVKINLFVCLHQETGCVFISSPLRFYRHSNLLLECKKALDIVIAIDASGSVMSSPYRRIRSFVSTITTRFSSFKPTYFGLLHYNYKVITSATLQDQIPNSDSLRNRIRDMRYLGQATLTQAALASAKTLFDNGARNDQDVQKILLLFTDGRTYGGKQTLREPLKRLREVNT